MLRIKKNDIVSVIAGKDKGKKGKVITVFPSLSRVIVENINVAKKAVRRTQQNQKGGFVDLEMPIHISNLMLFCKHCNKPVRFKINILKDGTKTRECKKCGASF